MSGDLSNKVAASANYLGSVFSSAWNKTAKTANDATANSSSFISSAITKVTGSGVAAGENSKEEENKEGESEQAENDSTSNDSKPTAAMTASSLFTSAIGSFGFAKTEEDEKHKDNMAEKEEDEPKAGSEHHHLGFGMPGGFSSALNTLGKVAVDATQSIKDKVSHANMLAEFNKEQDSFIKSNKARDGGDSDSGVAPWVGYQGEEELKAKILSLSEDRRNFVRAPPSGVTFEFEYTSVSPTALALLQEDPKLQEMRYDLVPKQVKEEEFWRNYFYRVSLIKQSFELKDLERGEKTEKKRRSVRKNEQEEEVDVAADLSVDQDEDFVSDSYQASTSDMAEADEGMRKLGVNVDGGGNTEEWEAELEGELNEYEVVNTKGDNNSGGGEESNQEWENQIQEMLDAEENAK